jgi:predicted nuclease of predicted toxin-antitoxin system
MKLVADECVDRPIVDRLRSEGHSVDYVPEMAPSVDDNEVLRQANSQDAILMTGDKDFGELVFRQRRVHEGVILLRLFGVSPALKADIVAGVLQMRSADIPRAFTVISPGSVRIRHLP